LCFQGGEMPYLIWAHTLELGSAVVLLKLLRRIVILEVRRQDGRSDKMVQAVPPHLGLSRRDVALARLLAWLELQFELMLIIAL